LPSLFESFFLRTSVGNPEQIKIENEFRKYRITTVGLAFSSAYLSRGHTILNFQTTAMKKIYRLFLWAIIFLVAGKVRAQQDSTMYAHFINVGQAASVLLEFPCGAVLIDAGAQDDTYHKKLLDYLTGFFARRTDLNNTIALVMVTHPHIDHNEVLRDVAQNFQVARYIDDGIRLGTGGKVPSGKPNQIWMQDNASIRGTVYRTYSFEDITKGGNKNGLTDTVIDPINCPNGDPQIILYSSRLIEKPDDWSATDYNNYNNQSLVIKVVFGKTSFLFTGDLENKGIKNVVDEYDHTDALNVDILMVGHHGAGNATTEEYLTAVTPKMAVISCGPSDFGKGSNNPFTTFAYGHPRISTINMLEEDITSNRSRTLQVEAAEGVRDFRLINIDKRIYATPWDGNIVIRATFDGTYRVGTEN
jgi:competence protein ComEC